MSPTRRTILRTTGLAVGAATIGVGTGIGSEPTPAGQTIDPSLDLAADEPQEVLVVFDENHQVDLLDQFDLADGYHKFEVLPIGFTRATGDQIAEIARIDPVRYVEANKELEWHNDDAREVTGAKAVHEDLGYTGETAHAAVIDSGVDGDHPDLQRNLQHNYRYVNPFSTRESTTWVDAEVVQQYGASGVTTDDNGHGTHTSGSVAGDGTASEGQYAGMAPDADLTVYSTGVSLLIIKAVAAYDHLIANHAPGEIGADADEAVYVVNNSYGISSPTLFNPSGALETATKEAYDKGILSVFSAGNAGPGLNTLNDYAKAPYNLSVAATHDDGHVTSFSSRGLNPDSSAYNGDRKAALDNLEEYHKVEKASEEPHREWSAEAAVGPGSDAGGIVSDDATYGESAFVPWTPVDDTGIAEVTASWTNTRQDIDVYLRKGGKDGPVVASSTNGQLTSGCGETCESLSTKRIEGGAEYTFELNPWASIQDTVTINVDEFEADTGGSSFEAGDPIGLYRNGVGAPGAHVMSTLDPAAPLNAYPALHVDNHPEKAARNAADQGTEPFYGHLSGTSMSAPVVTGVATLVVDAYNQQHAGSGSAGPAATGQQNAGDGRGNADDGQQNGADGSQVAGAAQGSAGYPTPDEILRFIEGTADHKYDTYTPANIGTGFVDAEEAVRATPDDLPTWEEVNANVVEYGDEPETLAVTGLREDGADFFTAGQTMRNDLTVGEEDDDEDPTHAVDEVYDVIPAEWEVDPVDGDDLQYQNGEPRTEQTDDGRTRVYLDASVPAGGSATFTYFVEAPEGAQGTGGYTFGPTMADSDDDDAGAVPVSGTTDTAYVVGQSTEVM